MDERVRKVGRRIRERLPVGMTQRALAARVSMTPDALSRALNGQRGFSILELERIADLLQVDLTWLITGRTNPLMVSVAARHSWDPQQGTRSNPSAESDQAVLQQVVEIYRAAFPDGPPPSPTLPRTPEAVSRALGPGFVRTFAERVETRLGIDVVRVKHLGTDYAIGVGSRQVIVLNATSSWFRSNWSLAHELGHLALRHSDEDGDNRARENAADAFAANVLLPAPAMRDVDWQGMTEPLLAELLWRWGVSTHALRTRLNYLGIDVGGAIAAALGKTTPAVLRRSGPPGITRAALAEREQLAAQRRLPLDVLATLTDRVSSGDAPPQLLAEALGVEVDDIDFPEPPDDVTDTVDALIDTRPTLEDLRVITSA